jgi:hypothetical protein
MFSYPLKGKGTCGWQFVKIRLRVGGENGNIVRKGSSRETEIAEQPADILRVIYFTSSLG